MPRLRRLHLPNVAFHITARTQAGAMLFDDDIRSGIYDDIEEATSSFGHTLLAQCVMINHFHIVIRQGETPLGWMMQRVMQKAIFRVRRTHGGQGHVFGQPYWAGAMPSAGYVRRAIVYTHMNPCKAGLCDHPSDYRWSSHNKFMAAERETSTQRNSALDGLMLFADNSVELARVIASYNRFVDFCIERRKSAIPGDWLLPVGPDRHMLPEAAYGDGHWATKFSSFIEAQAFTRPNVDVTSHAHALLKRIDRDLGLDDIRVSSHTKPLRKVRAQLVEGLVLAGCRGAAISRCLRVSPSYVSRIATSMRVSAWQKR